ncbi:MAG: NADH-quinone oxidoreductase subunit N [Bacteroidota bacterium]|nr:NADH-quinone oxidoreductase subunit N [Bacteroidota bacterium]
MSLDSILLLRFEWIITLIIFILLVLKLSDADNKVGALMKAINVLLFVNFAAGLLPIGEGSLFNGFFKTSELIVLEKNILNLGVLLISLASFTWLTNHKHRIEFYILMLSSMLGVYVMLSSGHLLMLYLGLEMSTIPVAALANFNKTEKRSSEAGVKFILSSTFSTGIMLFGISLLYGAVGNLSFESIIANLHPDALTLFAFAFILGGFGFKMSMVPFHLWTADVYEGSPVGVTNYLSVISKGSVIFIFITVLYTVFGGMKDAWLLAVGVLAVLSMTIGNLFALRQDNIKRLLAFSSISQVGFVLVGIAGAAKVGVTAVVYFVLIYMLSNIAAFGVAGAIADTTGKESLNKAYKGLYKSNPFYALILALALFSLAGVPPTAGFFGKLFLLTSGMGTAMYVVLGIAGINLVISLYNYLRVVKYMFIDEAEEVLPVVDKNKALTTALIVCIIGLLVIGFVTPIYQYIDSISFGM